MLIGQLASAIAGVEGWFNPGSRAHRNDNPGNLTASFLDRRKDDAGFVVFERREEGIAALLHQVAKDVARGLTLRQFLTKYAPPSENDTERYIRAVADETGVDPDAPLWSYLLLPKLR